MLHQIADAELHRTEITKMAFHRLTTGLRFHHLERILMPLCIAREITKMAFHRLTTGLRFHHLERILMPLSSDFFELENAILRQ